MARTVGPHFLEAEGASDASLFFQAFNRNKRSITLDLSKPGSRPVLERLVARSDAVASNLRGDVPAKLGLTYDRLAHANPKIVCAFLSAYGRDGSRAAWPGYDYLMQAEAGYFSLTGEAGTPPSRMGLSIVDLMTGLGQAFALVSAVLKARETGRGTDIDISLFDLACFNLSYLSAWYLNTGHVQGRVPRSGHPSLTPCQLYRTGDGWIFLMCNKEKFWPILCKAVGREEWAADPRFASFKTRLAHREVIEALLDEALSAQDHRRMAGAVRRPRPRRAGARRRPGAGEPVPRRAAVRAGLFASAGRSVPPAGLADPRAWRRAAVPARAGARRRHRHGAGRDRLWIGRAGEAARCRHRLTAAPPSPPAPSRAPWPSSFHASPPMTGSTDAS